MNAQPLVIISYSFTDSSTKDIHAGKAVWESLVSAESDWREAVMQISYAQRTNIINTRLDGVQCKDLEGFRAYAAKYTSGVKGSKGVTF
jgi:hypothetical protein